MSEEKPKKCEHYKGRQKGKYADQWILKCGNRTAFVFVNAEALTAHYARHCTGKQKEACSNYKRLN